MRFPDEDTVRASIDTVEFPPFYDIQYGPESPGLQEPAAEARAELDRLPP